MEEQKLAIQLFKNNRSGVDPVFSLLIALKKLKEDINLDLVANTYKDLIEGSVLLASIISRFEFDQQEKNSIEKKVRSKFAEQEIIFDFVVDKKAPVSLEIKVGDHILKA